MNTAKAGFDDRHAERTGFCRPYPNRPADGREDPDAAGERVTRRGDHVFEPALEMHRAAFRGGSSRAVLGGHRPIGFRCAK